MSLDVYLGYFRGIDSETLNEGDGITAPRLLSVTAISHNVIELEFDRDMDFDPSTSKILDVSSYVLLRDSDSVEQVIVRVEDDRDTPNDVPSARKVQLIVQNQVAGEYTITVLQDVMSATGVAIDPAFDELTYTSATPPQYSGGRIYSFIGLYAGMQDEEQITLPPTLVTTPTSPNPDITDPTYPMEWRTEDPDSTSSITLLQIEGVDVIVANVLQPGWTGTVVANGQGGWDVSINADNDYWPSKTQIAWNLTAADIFNTVNYNGTIDKYVTLPTQDYVPDREALINTSFDFPFRFDPDGDIVTARDEKAIEDNMRSSVMIRARGIPLFNQIGSRVPLMPFDPNDQTTYDMISLEIVDAIALGEPRVIVDNRVRLLTDSSGNAIALVLPYAYKSSMKGWRNFRLEEPEFKIIDQGNPKRV